MKAPAKVHGRVARVSAEGRWKQHQSEKFSISL